jgi:hypothetical protein
MQAATGLVVIAVAATLWIVWLHVQHMVRDPSVDCPAKQTSTIDGRPRLCLYVSKDEVRCYPAVCR